MDEPTHGSGSRDPSAQGTEGKEGWGGTGRGSQWPSRISAAKIVLKQNERRCPAASRELGLTLLTTFCCCACFCLKLATSLHSASFSLQEKKKKGQLRTNAASQAERRKPRGESGTCSRGFAAASSRGAHLQPRGAAGEMLLVNSAPLPSQPGSSLAHMGRDAGALRGGLGGSSAPRCGPGVWGGHDLDPAPPEV